MNSPMGRDTGTPRAEWNGDCDERADTQAASAARRDEAVGARKLLEMLGGAATIDAYIKVDPSVVAANGKASTGGYNALQKKSAELVGSAKYIAQFLDRDTDPDFASNVVGKGLSDFLADATKIDSILSTIEEQKKTFTFE
jgi:multiple sugar transport system substrate-binding protein